MPRTRLPLLRCCLPGLLALLSLCPRGWAAPVDDPLLALSPSLAPSAMLADELVLLARRGWFTGDEADAVQSGQALLLSRAGNLLDLALKLNASDAEVWRMRAEVATGQLDRPGQIAALTEYLKLRTDDDPARLALIEAFMAEAQTVQDRNDRLQRLLDADAQGRLSAPLRSRLHTLLAAHWQQLGDQDRFAAALSEALRLDPVNPTAAALAVELALERNARPLTVAVLLINAVKANPADPRLRLGLADQLLRLAAYPQAATQYEAARKLLQSPLPEHEPRYTVALAGAGQHEKALQMLTQIQQRLQSGDAQRTLPMELETLRLLVLRATNRMPEAEASLTRVVDELNTRAAAGSAAAASQALWLKVYFEAYVGDLDQAMAPLGVDDPVRQRIKGLMALRAGDTAAAREQLDPLVQAGDLDAAFVLARHTLKTDEPEGLAMLKDLIAQRADTLIGVAAQIELHAAGFRQPATPEALTLQERMAQWSGVLIDPDFERVRWTLLEMSMKPMRFQYMEPMTVTLSLRNATSLPLSLGEGGVLPAEAYLAPSQRSGGVSTAPVSPVRVSLARKLKLDPDEAVEVSVRLNSTPFGQRLAASPVNPYSFDLRGVVDPVITQQDRQLRNGPLGSTASIYYAERQGSPVTDANATRWIAQLEEPDPPQRFRLLAALCVLAPELLAQKDDAAVAMGKRMAEAVRQRYATGDAVARAWVARFAALNDPEGKAFSALLTDAGSSEDLLVRVVHLESVARTPDHPALAAAVGSGDEKLAAYATQLQQLLALEAQARAKAQAEAEAEAEAKAAAQTQTQAQP